LVFAVVAARKLGAYGETAEVCLMGEDGHFHPEWNSRPEQARPRA
jgi:hypothetical protein